MKPRVFTLEELLERSRLTPDLAALFLDGPEGFVEKRLVARVPGGYVITEKGWRLIGAYTLLKDAA